MIKYSRLTEMLDKRLQEAQGAGRSRASGAAAFVRELRDDVLCITEDNHGNPTIGSGAARPEEFSIKEMAEAICGPEFVREYFNPTTGIDRVGLLEAGPAGGLDPTAMLNINAFSLAVGGLIEAKIIEQFQHPAFIGDQLVQVKPTRLNGEKMIGVTGIGNKALTRKPGEPHPEAGFGEHWITTPELEEKALKVPVLQETVFYDLTGQVLDTAAGVGQELGYLKELTILNLALGVTNPYKYKGTGYNTYQASTPWINSHANPLTDYRDIDDALALFEQMTDPATGKEILVMPTTILHAPSRRSAFHQVLNATEVRETTNTNTVSIAPNPVKTKYALVESPIAYNRAKAADGLNLSTADAKARWWIGDFKRAFAWMEAWPIRVTPASANEFVMLDRGMIACYFANYRGIGAVIEPRYVVQNTA